MTTKFHMTHLGMLTYYLGIEVCQRAKFLLHKKVMQKKVLKDACMFDCNPTLILIDSNVTFSKGGGKEDTEAVEYHSLVGRLVCFL